MINNPTLFDAIIERDTAMDTIEDKTDPDWAHAAENSILWLARSRKHFSTDDVWKDLSLRDTPLVHDNRALGPIMARLAKQGKIKVTGHYTPSVRRHCSPIRLWEAV